MILYNIFFKKTIPIYFFKQKIVHIFVTPKITKKLAYLLTILKKIK
ncbi:hypothetical protein BC670_1929 [Flavobacterium branchiophilum]|uniref:Uncharacterized protein n=1 Tax=Flavobacterium branchiophilum TaxID=55197 RepID=A0A543G4K5_9FLAO|nr:hypothetical protein BC670_1929 [Flavobacterium branchiophilum]